VWLGWEGRLHGDGAAWWVGQGRQLVVVEDLLDGGGRAELQLL